MGLLDCYGELGSPHIVVGATFLVRIRVLVVTTLVGLAHIVLRIRYAVASAVGAVIGVV